MRRTKDKKFWIEALAAPLPQSPSCLMGFADKPQGAHVANCGHDQRPPWGLPVVPTDSSQDDLLRTPLSILGLKYGLKRHILDSLDIHTLHSPPWEMQRNCAMQPVERKQGRSCVFGGTRWSQAGVEERGSFRQLSGAGDLIQRHEPCVPKGPECHWPSGRTTRWGCHRWERGEASLLEGPALPSTHGAEEDL